MMDFYKNNAESYAQITYNEDFAKAVFEGMKGFLIALNPDEPILDIGCGSGRDAYQIIKQGFNVHAFDQSKEMIEQAKKLTGLENVFNVGSAQSFKSYSTYNFAYSIACLLHLNDEEFKLAIENIFKHLNTNGCFYFTVKKGDGEEVDNEGRYFNYYTEEKLHSVCSTLGIQVINITENPDLTRPDTTWLNVVLRKVA